MGVKKWGKKKVEVKKSRGKKVGLKKVFYFIFGILDNIFSKYPRFVRNFLRKLRFFKNSEFFTKDVLKRLLGGIETISVIY